MQHSNALNHPSISVSALCLWTHSSVRVFPKSIFAIVYFIWFSFESGSLASLAPSLSRLLHARRKEAYPCHSLYLTLLLLNRHEPGDSGSALRPPPSDPWP